MHHRDMQGCRLAILVLLGVLGMIIAFLLRILAFVLQAALAALLRREQGSSGDGGREGVTMSVLTESPQGRWPQGDVLHPMPVGASAATALSSQACCRKLRTDELLRLLIVGDNSEWCAVTRLWEMRPFNAFRALRTTWMLSMLRYSWSQARVLLLCFGAATLGAISDGIQPGPRIKYD